MTYRSKAKNDLCQMVCAVKAYYIEYGYYPLDKAKGSGASIAPSGDSFIVGAFSDNSELIDVLRNNTASAKNGALVAKMNPREIVFLEVPPVKDDAHPKSGVHSKTGVWHDPWGTPYNLAMDTGYDNQITGLPRFYSDFPKVGTGVIAWSYGKDKMAGTNGNNAYANSDDIISWQ